MSKYGDYINKVLSERYKLIKTFKTDGLSTIELYNQNESDNKLIKIQSVNRNDHIFRKIRGHKHKNLPIIYDVCSADEYVTVLESYVEGETLADILKEKELSTNKALKYIADICNALEFLHNLNIIHRDVKPGNIIITPKDTAVLIDLSAARFINEEKQQDTANLGTVGYAAPEQFGIYQSTPPTDIYALGVMFNEMLTKHHPSLHTPSGKLGKIIKKCTNTQISERYQSIDVLRYDLEQCQNLTYAAPPTLK